MQRGDRIRRACDVQLFAKSDRKFLQRPSATGSIGVKRGIPLLFTMDETSALVVADRIHARVSELPGQPGHLVLERLELVVVGRLESASQQALDELDIAVKLWIGRDLDLSGDRPGLDRDVGVAGRLGPCGESLSARVQLAEL